MLKIMENTTYDEVDLTQITINEAYSAIKTETNPSYELKKNRRHYYALKGVKEINVSGSPNTIKYITVMTIIMIVIYFC